MTPEVPAKRSEAKRLPSTVASWPLVSVVVPVYNGRDTIAACIEALLAQDYPTDRREIIVVDNNSDDGTAEIVRQKPVTLLHERDIQGSYAARNTGVRQARGEIVAFTDADCVPQPGWLSHLVAGFDEPTVVGVAGSVVPAHAHGLVAEFLADVDPVRSRQIDGLWYAITANVAYRREALLAAGCFRPHLLTAGDIDLALRLQLDGYGSIKYAPQAIVQHEYGDSLRELWRRFQRYGYSEILLANLRAPHTGSSAQATDQLLGLARQVGALGTYVLSFLWRLRRLPQHGWMPRYNLRPLLWAVAESASLGGKLQALCPAVSHREQLWPHVAGGHKQVEVGH